jgi:oligoribonuclease NrnB/cAMP/cGMP phosphodiesterase (DHH superfamily)
MKKLVLFHANCNDGFGAAWVAHRVFGSDAKYKPVQYGDPPPRNVAGREVYILDFSYRRDVLLELKEQAGWLLVLDHHVTAQQDLEGLDFARFDLERSGATIAWRHFFPDDPCPWLLEYIEDKDLWRWQLDHSEEVSAGLQSYPRNFQTWNEIVERGADYLIAEGKPIVRYKKRLVEAAASRIRMIEMDGYRVPCVTSCLLQSEIGSRLAKKHPFVAIKFEIEGRRVWSLRSHTGSGVDVGKIATKHGGGGHKHAAGFIEPLDSI